MLGGSINELILLLFWERLDQWLTTEVSWFLHLQSVNVYMHTYIEDDHLTEPGQVAVSLVWPPEHIVSPAADEGGSEFVTGVGGKYVYQETSDFDDVVEDIPVALLIKPLSRSPMTRSAKNLSCIT